MFHLLWKTNKCLFRQVSLLLIFHLLTAAVIFSQTTYQLNSGPWGQTASWEGGLAPPDVLPAGDAIVILGAASLSEGEVDELGIDPGANLRIATGGGLSVTNVNIVNRGTFDNEGSFTSKGADFTNSGNLNNREDASFSFGDMTENTMTNTGQINNSPGAMLIINGSTFNQNNELNNEGAFSINGIVVNSLGAQINNNSSGTIELGSSSTPAGELANRGLIVNNGAFNYNETGSFTQLGKDTDGMVQGGGDFNGDWTIPNGTLAPGNSFGAMTISGSLTLGSGVTLLIEIVGGATPGNDLIDVSGTFNLGGSTLTVVKTTGSFNASENWEIITASSISGSFGDVNLPEATPPSAGDFTFVQGASTFDVNYLGSSFLPVALSMFNGQVMDDAIRLDWTTETETNNHYFLIERSGDGLSFQAIGRISGKGTTLSPQQYQFVDEAPLERLNYYRLRQFDLDGTESVFGVISVDMKQHKKTPSIRLYPNPAQHYLHLEWNSNKESENRQVRLLHAVSGREVARFIWPAGAEHLEIPLGELAAGQYVVQFLSGQKTRNMRFIKH